MVPEIDLVADLNAEDDDGLGWSSLSDARDAVQVRPGVMLVAGNRFGKAVVRVIAVDEDGQVHFTVLLGRWRRIATSSAEPWPEDSYRAKESFPLRPISSGRDAAVERAAHRTGADSHKRRRACPRTRPESPAAQCHRRPELSGGAPGSSLYAGRLARSARSGSQGVLTMGTSHHNCDGPSPSAEA
jgi:hypothetical protein